MYIMCVTYFLYTLNIFCFSNKLTEHGKTQQQVKEAADKTKKSLQGHLMHAKETFMRNLDHQYTSLCQSIDETVQKDLENLAELEDQMKKEIENIKNLVDNGRYNESKFRGNCNIKLLNRKI